MYLVDDSSCLIANLTVQQHYHSYPESPSPAHSHPSSTANLHKKKADIAYVFDDTQQR